MAEYHLKVKLGQHEFEADGPTDAVKSQFEAFKDLIASVGGKSETNPQSLQVFPEPPTSAPIPFPVAAANVDRIFRQKGRVISFTVPPSSETDAVLLILYGQKHYRNNESPTGSEVVDGLEESGYHAPRLGRILTTLSNDNAIIINGAHRGKRYRLTNQGFSRAEAIVREALAKLP